MAFAKEMPKENRLWYRLTRVKAALIVLTCIGSKIRLVHIESLPKIGFCAARIFFIAAVTLQQVDYIFRIAMISTRGDRERTRVIRILKRLPFYNECTNIT